MLAEAVRDEPARRRRGEEGHRLVQYCYAWERVAREMEEAYARVMTCVRERTAHVA